MLVGWRIGRCGRRSIRGKTLGEATVGIAVGQREVGGRPEEQVREIGPAAAILIESWGRWGMQTTPRRLLAFEDVLGIWLVLDLVLHLALDLLSTSPWCRSTVSFTSI